MLESLFVTGTDTDAGKTYVTAGLAASLSMMGVDVGVMKPFAAGTAQKNGFKSNDVRMLADAAGIHDVEDLLNPQFFPIPASPYTAYRNLNVRPRVADVMRSFKQLQSMHDILLVEGIGGIMTPIWRDFFIADLIRNMKLPVAIVSRSRIGTINHTVMTCMVCRKFDIPIKGIIVNCFDQGYPAKELVRDLKAITGTTILGSVPVIDSTDRKSLYNIFSKCIDIESLFGL